MGRQRKISKKYDRWGGGGLALTKSEKTHCADPAESHISAPIPEKSALISPKLTSPDKSHAKSSSIRPFSRQFGRKYHLLDEQTRLLLHTAAKTAAIPKLPIGTQPELDPDFSATAVRLMDEVSTSLKAIHFHEIYFPLRHKEREVILDQLKLTHARLNEHLSSWKPKR